GDHEWDTRWPTGSTSARLTQPLQWAWNLLAMRLALAGVRNQEWDTRRPTGSTSARLTQPFNGLRTC
ncbi:MAG: hypothetical protein WA009_04420, partial [Phototrophicaceae bacterium]